MRSVSIRVALLAFGASCIGGTQDEPRCHAAVCFSGTLGSFMHPIVNRSVRRNVIDALAAGGCHVDTFAYVTVEDSTSSNEKERKSTFKPKDNVAQVASKA
ncbi:unnamed protein product, partial [Discosporangium mesarthrocarpum]